MAENNSKGLSNPHAVEILRVISDALSSDLAQLAEICLEELRRRLLIGRLNLSIRDPGEFMWSAIRGSECDSPSAWRVTFPELESCIDKWELQEAFNDWRLRNGA
ncbi:MAG: hypothetical protein NT069_32230 [Planctomycetota bacterium]|nr:hypothetical protein [Planctomycetota bacterium]